MTVEDGFNVVFNGASSVADHDKLKTESFEGDFGCWEALRDCALEEHEGDECPPSSPIAGAGVEGLRCRCDFFAKESGHGFQGGVGGRGFEGVEGHGFAIGDLELGEWAWWGEDLLTDFCRYVRGNGGEVGEGRDEAARPFGVEEERRGACMCVSSGKFGADIYSIYTDPHIYSIYLYICCI